MKKINLEDLQRQIDSRQLKESKPNEQKPLNEDAMWNLWVMMTKLFHRAWTSREGEEPTDIWGKLLTELSQDQVNNGFDKILSWESPFPPTVLQFRQLCLPEGIAPRDRKGVGNSAAYLRFDDPKHPRNDPLSPEYVRPLDKRIEHVSTRRQTGKDALKAILDGL